MKKNLIFLIFCLIVAFFGCKKDKNEPEKTNRKYRLEVDLTKIPNGKDIHDGKDIYNYCKTSIILRISCSYPQNAKSYNQDYKAHSQCKTYIISPNYSPGTQKPSDLDSVGILYQGLECVDLEDGIWCSEKYWLWPYGSVFSMEVDLTPPDVSFPLIVCSPVGLKLYSLDGVLLDSLFHDDWCISRTYDVTADGKFELKRESEL